MKMDNDEIIEKYLHNNFGRTASEQALNEARADEREKWSKGAITIRVNQKAVEDAKVEERQRIKKIIEELQDNYTKDKPPCIVCDNKGHQSHDLPAGSVFKIILDNLTQIDKVD